MKNIESWENEMHNLAASQTTPPPSFVWDNIEKVITQPEKKRRWLLPWFLFGTLLCAGGILLFSMPNDKLTKPADSKKKDHPSSAEYAMDNAPSSTLQDNNTTNPATAGLRGQNKPAQHDQAVAAISEPSKSPLLHTDNIKANRYTGNSENAAVGQNTNPIGDYKPTSNKNKNRQKTTALSLRENKKSNNVNAQENPVNRNTVASSSDQFAKSGISAQNSYNNQPAIGLYGNNVTDFLSGLHPQLLTTKRSLIHASQYLKKPRPECPTFGKKKKNSFFVGIEGGLGLPLKNMTADPDQETFLNQRKNTEKSWYSWGGGVQIGYMIKDKWSIATGVNVAQIKDKFNMTIKGYTSIHIILDPNGNPVDTTIVTGTLQEEGEKRFTLIDIPLSLGYEHRSGDWGLAVELGATFNLSLSSEGKILDAGSKVIRLEDRDDIFKTNIGLGMQGAVAIHRYIGDHTSVYIKPAYRTYFNDWTAGAYPVKTSYNLATLSVGLRYKF